MFKIKQKNGKMFTGALDKNGKEIYEDDKVSGMSHWNEFANAKGRIRYIPKRAKFAVFFDELDFFGKNDFEGENHNWADFDEFDEIEIEEEQNG